MNKMLKVAYDAGCMAALNDCGVKVAADNSSDISPAALAALGLIPGVGDVASATAAGYYAPRGRIMSRVGHNIGGGLLGGITGGTLGSLGGAGIGALAAKLQDEDPYEYGGKGALIGAILGSVGGGALGRYNGQTRSQSWDGEEER